ncbi:uroporphyrin-III C/tetrapyrrole (corrin/porphyrin) methyltransferase, putative [Rhizoctonia solani AG-3 Rhs1AP]|uniref:Uroporphyrin-III C/tetrapyrrole (Corrin/porphyrin) methyltransferase, putative n=1 Tax=Rhizoctonia solani AG-3 Rhs1AP TaxID=1086054 RepID=X8JFY6_9AGAM|nr:uroporphyrin-III C/tetrapyrrole (corrin/porphyrin) methyltransferase, putative [Rhizoctonia solani AG-3 Rhs1AP]
MTDRPSGITKRGSLIIAGSGIASVCHITLETVSCMETTDKIFYLVTDPITEAYIQEKNNNTFNLCKYYDKTKQRYQSYVEMAEVMLREVRTGCKVLGIFYGHPGFFATPAHRALTLARAEGYAAKMLAGISSFDYMLSDLEFEPALYGCTIHEATDLLARDRRLDPSAHNIILQIAAAGVTTLEDEPENSKLQLLVTHLERDFGLDHKVILYSGAVFPLSSTAMVVYTIENLRNAQVAEGISSSSSLYIPPRDIPPINPSMSDQLQLHDYALPLLGTPPVWEGSRFINPVTYGPVERRFVAELDQHVVPGSHRTLHASPAMRRFTIELALNRTTQCEYHKDPVAVVESVPNLTDRERSALKLAHAGAISLVMSRTSHEEPTEEQLAAVFESEGDNVLGEPMYSAAF